jgi:hypothetical protein
VEESERAELVSHMFSCDNAAEETHEDEVLVIGSFRLKYLGVNILGLITHNIYTYIYRQKNKYK